MTISDMVILVVTFFSSIAPSDLKAQLLSHLAIDGVELYSAEGYGERFTSYRTDGKQLIIFIGTGGTEQDVKGFLESVAPPSSVLLLSHPGNNSLPASMEIRSFLESAEIDSEILHLTLSRLSQQLTHWVEFEKIISNIRNTRMVTFGESSSWLIASQIDYERVKKNWGFKIIPQIMGLVKPKGRNSSQDTIVSHCKDSADQVEVSEEAVSEAIQVQKLIENVISLSKINAITIQCFSLFEDTGITACHALSILNEEEELVAGCEGDIPSTFTMMVVKMLTGQPSFMANVISVNEEHNTAIFAHCTIPRSMTETHDLVTHFETDASVAIRGKLQPQDVTIVKIGGLGLSNYWISKGTILENLQNEDGCRTQIHVKIQQPVDYFLKRSLANHHIIVLGDHTKRIKSFLKFALHKNPIE
ncbi:MAG: hypothetical protein GF411_15945 [Candidatus Lokiarchaeota archaeon]|nr:hypothetical protein [Candidatus Lokiarchaeota archaeon]